MVAPFSTESESLCFKVFQTGLNMHNSECFQIGWKPLHKDVKLNIIA